MSEEYDPQEPEEGRPSNQHVTRKDLRIIAIVLLVLVALGWPVYMYMLGSVNTSLCKKNLRKIGSALVQYTADFDDHLPFCYQRAGFNSDDVAVTNGLAYTWQWQLDPYIKNWGIFKCPAASEEEHTLTADPMKGEAHISDYGMLDAYSGAGYSTIANPGQKYIISETSSRGALGTLDPVRLSSGGVELKDDGFMIGFDNDARYPNESTKFATRLAYPKSATTGFDHDGDSRHPMGIHFLYVDTHIALRDPAAARVIQLGGSYGPWDVPKLQKPTGRMLPGP